MTKVAEAAADSPTAGQHTSRCDATSPPHLRAEPVGLLCYVSATPCEEPGRIGSQVSEVRMRSRRHALVPAALTAVCVVALIGVATAATPTVPGVVSAQSGHWLVDKAQRTVLHVHARAADVDARVTLPDVAAQGAVMALQGVPGLPGRLIDAREKAIRLGLTDEARDLTDPSYLYALVRRGYVSVPERGPVAGG